MESKKSDGFLTCMQACDTISLMCGMDFNSLITNSKEFMDACVVVLETKMSDLPIYMIKPIMKVQDDIAQMLGWERVKTGEGINGSSWAAILDV